MKRKVFCIGFHKTGTTSIGRALEILGYKNCHGAGEMRKLWGNDDFHNMLQQKNYQRILEFAENYESFNDNPWYFLYKELDLAFPGSKFILTIRDEKSWLGSAKKYFGKSNNPIRKLIYGQSSIVNHEELYLSRYLSHNLHAQKYFLERLNDLLIIDLYDPKKWEKLCHFLKKNVPDVAFPHLNSKTD